MKLSICGIETGCNGRISSTTLFVSPLAYIFKASGFSRSSLGMSFALARLFFIDPAVLSSISVSNSPMTSMMWSKKFVDRFGLIREKTTIGSCSPTSSLMKAGSSEPSSMIFNRWHLSVHVCAFTSPSRKIVNLFAAISHACFLSNTLRPRPSIQ